MSAEGLEAHPEKIRAVRKMPVPQNKEEVKRFLAMIQYLSKFLTNTGTVDEPLRAMIKQDVDFYWLAPQQQSFDELKNLCISVPVLARLNPAKQVTIQCDASRYGLGGALLQAGRPIALTARALNATEQRYAQLEKETLAKVYVCQKFHFYIFGCPVTV